MSIEKMAREIAEELLWSYRYYEDVYFDFIIEAVKNTLIDFEGEVKEIEEIHQHIINNYI